MVGREVAADAADIAGGDLVEGWLLRVLPGCLFALQHPQLRGLVVLLTFANIEEGILHVPKVDRMR